jgi:hypothetical protein
MKRALLVVTALIALAGSARAAKPAVQTAFFVSAQATLAIDMFQTLDIKNSVGQFGGPPRRCETGWAGAFIGTFPKDGAVYGYFGALMAANTALYLWGPLWLSNMANGAIIMIEVPTLARNYAVGARFSF